jgi:hypothetical protein
MATAAVFWAFLAPFVALVAGLTLVTFSSLKRRSRGKKLLLVGLFVGGITALGWAPLLVSSSIAVWLFVSVLVVSSFYEAVVILFVWADILNEKMTEESPDRALRTRKDYIF